MDCTIRVVKTKALISVAATAKLICVFVLAYAKSRFSHDEAQLLDMHLIMCSAFMTFQIYMYRYLESDICPD